MSNNPEAMGPSIYEEVAAAAREEGVVRGYAALSSGARERMSVLASPREFPPAADEPQNPTRGQRIVDVESTIAGVRANPARVPRSGGVGLRHVIAKSVAQLPWPVHKVVGRDRRRSPSATSTTG